MSKKNKPFLKGTPTTFSKAFPEVEEITVEITETGDFKFEKHNPLVYNKSNIPTLVDCSNPICQNGGLDLEGIVRGMIYSQNTSHESSSRCKGKEGAPNSRHANLCDNFFSYKVSIKFK